MDRAIAVMHDLSGLQPGKDDCSTIIEDWKHLQDNVGADIRLCKERGVDYAPIACPGFSWKNMRKDDSS